ncbi:hypothetical protein GWK18_06785 [Kocuria sp. JC486]|uniref:hypothetical protein n=1 Tax=Kocuria sp. JC486 TaxID=1970736 RepID=UPI0014208585|nr:hypothetical protein [Kocuria sp. JC486]NHU85299.1 hypothetical protein [Kocuria sp. JC486]
MGLFGRKSNPEQQQPEAPREENTAVAEPLPAEGPLRNLVTSLLADNAEAGKLTLIQRGNTMSQQSERSVAGQTEMDNGTVDQSHPLFEDVAALYTESMSRDTGAWQTAVVAVGKDTDGTREVQVDYDFPSAPHKTERYSLDQGAAAGTAAGAAAGGSQDGTEPSAEDRNRGDGRDSDGRGADGRGADATDRDAVDRGGVDGGADDRSAGTGAAAAGAGAGIGAGALAAAAAQGRRDQADGDASAQTSAEGSQAGESADAEQPAGGATSTSAPAAAQPAAADRSTGADTRGGNDLPQHVDHDEWRDDNAGRTGAQATGAAAAGAAAGAGLRGGVAGDSDAPTLAKGADVAPSYRAGEAAGAGSRDKLAEGNKVLTEGDVLKRLSGAQRRLFGPEGSARDVSTVLIRVRTLGSYYDALTHVRQGGFWDQRNTFDLVPEEELKVQELKEDSYVEGEGAPLAVMFRFRPGIPPEVSFDYADEEAFVRYPERLPSQNYVEELRMYPRTGANIPQHMDEALQDWNY